MYVKSVMYALMIVRVFSYVSQVTSLPSVTERTFYTEDDHNTSETIEVKPKSIQEYYSANEEDILLLEKYHTKVDKNDEDDDEHSANMTHTEATTVVTREKAENFTTKEPCDKNATFIEDPYDVDTKKVACDQDFANTTHNEVTTIVTRERTDNITTELPTHLRPLARKNTEQQSAIVTVNFEDSASTPHNEARTTTISTSGQTHNSTTTDKTTTLIEYYDEVDTNYVYNDEVAESMKNNNIVRRERNAPKTTTSIEYYDEVDTNIVGDNEDSENMTNNKAITELPLNTNISSVLASDKTTTSIEYYDEVDTNKEGDNEDSENVTNNKATTISTSQRTTKSYQYDQFRLSARKFRANEINKPYRYNRPHETPDNYTIPITETTETPFETSSTLPTGFTDETTTRATTTDIDDTTTDTDDTDDTTTDTDDTDIDDTSDTTNDIDDSDTTTGDTTTDTDYTSDNSTNTDDTATPDRDKNKTNSSSGNTDDASQAGRDYCSFKCNTSLNGITLNHLMCKYPQGQLGDVCSAYGAKESPLSESDKKYIVHEHNERRSKVAQGKETRGNPGPQPSASIMVALTWDKELETMAKRWAFQCDQNDEVELCKDLWEYKVSLSVALSRPDSGDLLWGGDTTTAEDDTTTAEPTTTLVGDNQSGVAFAINMWYDEVDNVSSLAETQSKYNRETRHYKQMVCGSTTRIGCARMLFTKPKQCFFLVCMYAPAVGTADPYEVGKPCQGCNDVCGNTYPGLCNNTGISSPPPVFGFLLYHS